MKKVIVGLVSFAAIFALRSAAGRGELCFAGIIGARRVDAPELRRSTQGV